MPQSKLIIHLISGILISGIGFLPFRYFLKKKFTKHLKYFFLSYWAFCLLIFLFLIASGGFTFYINTSIWYEFGSFIGAFLLAATLLFQIRSFRRQQVESKFFEMVKYYRDNVIQMKLRDPFHDDKHEETHAEGRKVLKVIFNQYKVARGIVDYESIVDINKIDDCLRTPKGYNPFFSSQADQKLSSNQKKLFIENEIAYLIVYWGVSSGTVKEIENWLTKQFKLKDKEKEKNDYPELQTELIRKILKCVAFYKCDCDDDCHLEYSDLIYSHLKQTSDRSFTECPNSIKKTKFFSGHQYQLGHYFRHLYQAVKFIDQQPAWLFSKVEKYEYAKILRAQMSNYEQALLFINSLTVLGRNWEYNNKERKRLITEYHMIKNLPQHFIPNMDPQNYYPDVNYEWKEKSKNIINNSNEMSITCQAKKWESVLSFWNLIFKKYRTEWLVVTYATLGLSGVLIAFVTWSDNIKIYWWMLPIAALLFFISVRYSWKKTERVIGRYYSEIQIEGEKWNHKTIKAIRKKVLGEKIGVRVSNPDYIEFLLDAFDRRRNLNAYSYPLIIAIIGTLLGVYLGFRLNAFDKLIKTDFEYEQIVNFLGVAFIVIILLALYIDILVLRKVILSVRNRRMKVVECLEEILKELKFDK